MKNSILLFTFLLLISCGDRKNTKTEEKQPIKAIKSEVIVKKLDITLSSLKWKGYEIIKSDISSHSGILPIKSGSLVFEGKKLVGGKIVADVANLKNSDIKENNDSKAKLESHLKSSDFFDVENYPESIFEITNVKPHENKLMISGNLTIKDITKNITVHGELRHKDQNAILIIDPFDIDRQKWNINYKISIKDAILSDNISIEFYGEAR